MANSDLIAQALTYRPQYGEFLVPAQYTLAQVDRNELATAYPIIFGLEIIGDLLTVTTSDCHLPIIKGIALEKDVIEVRSQDVIYRNNMDADGLPTNHSISWRDAGHCLTAWAFSISMVERLKFLQNPNTPLKNKYLPVCSELFL